MHLRGHRIEMCIENVKREAHTFTSPALHKEAGVKWETRVLLSTLSPPSALFTVKPVCQLIITLRPGKPDQMKTVTSSSRLLFARPGREQFPNCCFAALLCQPATLSLNDKHTVLFSGDPAELQESVGLRIKTHTQMIVCQVLVHKSSSRNERCGSKASSCSDKNCLCIFRIKPRKSMFWFQIAGYHVRQVLLCLFLSLF